MPWNLLFAIAALLASYVFQALLATPTAKPEKANLDEFDFPQVEEGTPQSVIFGDVWSEAWMVLWYGNLRTTTIKSEVAKK